MRPCHALVLIGLWTSTLTAATLSSNDVSKWTESASPLQESPSNNPLITWTVNGVAIDTSNGSGSLVGGNIIEGDFTFSTTVRPLSAEFPDNDLWGIAFGWQDLSNHYRIGWSGGGNPDSGLGGTGADGLFLVKEVNGVGTLLFNEPALFWQNDVDYEVSVSRQADLVSFSVERATDSIVLASFSTPDAEFMKGQLALWVESQSARFGPFDLNHPDPNQIFFDDFEQEPEPVDPRGFNENYDAFSNWNVEGSGVDLFARRFFPEQGIVVDLDGTTGSTLVTRDAVELAPGTYQLSFDLGGPLGGIATDNVLVTVDGLFSDSITIRRGDPFETIVREFDVESSTSAHLKFQDLGADSNGAFLDNVSLRRIIAPVELLGDFDSDEALTIGDLEQLTLAIKNGESGQFDLDRSGVVDIFDRLFWVRQLKGTDFGDANLDGLFNTEDLIQVFQAGEYADGIAGNSTWSEGDFGGDGEFDTDDLVLAFQTGTYEQQATKESVRAVPEPSSFAIPLAGLLLSILNRRSRTVPYPKMIS